jgi:hypothetical protein
MWPWAHAALGYWCYHYYRRRSVDAPPAGLSVVALAVGTQFPDLLDKPLAWYVGVLPTGRSLAHSVLTGGLLLAVAVALLRARGPRGSPAAFAIGYGSHLLGDAFEPLMTANWADLAFLVWPLLPSPASGPTGLLAQLRAITAASQFLFGLALTATALVRWYRDGLPGLRALGALLARRQLVESR